MPGTFYSYNLILKEVWFVCLHHNINMILCNITPFCLIILFNTNSTTGIFVAEKNKELPLFFRLREAVHATLKIPTPLSGHRSWILARVWTNRNGSNYWVNALKDKCNKSINNFKVTNPLLCLVRFVASLRIHLASSLNCNTRKGDFFKVFAIWSESKIVHL